MIFPYFLFFLCQIEIFRYLLSRKQNCKISRFVSSFTMGYCFPSDIVFTLTLSLPGKKHCTKISSSVTCAPSMDLGEFSPNIQLFHLLLIHISIYYLSRTNPRTFSYFHKYSCRFINFIIFRGGIQDFAKGFLFQPRALLIRPQCFPVFE